MCNSPGVTRATDTYAITNATDLQDLVATGATAIDVRPGQGSLKGLSRTTATRRNSAAGIAMQYRGAADSSVAITCRDAARLRLADQPSATRASFVRLPLSSPAATRPGISHQFMVGRALPARGANLQRIT